MNGKPLAVSGYIPNLWVCERTMFQLKNLKYALIGSEFLT